MLMWTQVVLLFFLSSFLPSSSIVHAWQVASSSTFHSFLSGNHVRFHFCVRDYNHKYLQASNDTVYTLTFFFNPHAPLSTTNKPLLSSRMGLVTTGGTTFTETSCFDTTLSNFMEANGISGAAVSVLKDGKYVYEQGYVIHNIILFPFFFFPQ